MIDMLPDPVGQMKGQKSVCQAIKQIERFRTAYLVM